MRSQALLCIHTTFQTENMEMVGLVTATVDTWILVFGDLLQLPHVFESLVYTPLISATEETVQL